MPIRPVSPSSLYGRIDGGSMMTNGMSSNVYVSIASNNPAPFIQQSYQMGRTRNLTISYLPFYDKLSTVLELTELAPNISGIRSPARVVCNFSVPQQYISKLCYRGDTTPLPRLELQLRFCSLELHKEQPDDFPPNCTVKIDDVPVTLPNIIPTNKPNVEPKRPSRPVNITPYCQPPRDHTQRPYRMAIEWSADKRAWAVGIFVVNRLTSSILLQRLMSNVNAYRDGNVTKLTIQDRLSGGSDDDGVRMEKLRLSLLCPLGKTRMVVPGKPSDCSHLQCFDLSLFLQMNEKRPTWKCGICNNPAPYSKLVIDGYFQNILKEVGSDVQEVELLSDGDWRPVLGQLEAISDDEEAAKNLSNGVPFPSRPTNAASASNFQQGHIGSGLEDDDIIVLDSDDEEEEPRKKNRASNTSATTATRSTSNQSVVCIELDDSDIVEPSAAGTSSSISAVNTSTVSQTISPSCIPLPSNQGSTYLSIPSAAAPVCAITPSVQGTVPNPPLIRQVPECGETWRPSYYPGIYTGQQQDSLAYFGLYSHQSHYNSIPPELNTRTIEEELRNFMANIQQSSSTFRSFS